MSTKLEQLNVELASIVGEAQRSLVQVHDDARGAGAGSILHSDGLVITNAHVVHNTQPRVTLWDGRTLPGRLIARDERHDLAAIALAAADLPTLELANGREPQAGQWVVALGHPWGVRGAISAGMVIAVGRPVEAVPYPGDLIQVGVQLRPGHSGGPMLNGVGQLVGVNTMIAGPHVGLAIPVQTVKRFLKETLGSSAQQRPRQAQPRML